MKRVLGALLCLVSGVAGRNVTVSLEGLGKVVGVASTTYQSFRGIPYAAPPVGDKRWRPPQPVDPWVPESWDATNFRHNCMQSGGFDPPMLPGTVSEDCLYLNVYTPPDAKAKSLPVMFWLHGGGFQGGGSNESRLDGTWDVALAKNVVIVVVNYRLNVFGFAGSELLRKRDPAGSVGNYGILDQRAALQWVQQHIHAFGGDPSRVLLVGESAGGASVAQHLVRPKSWGLFSRAAMESGSFNLDAVPMESAEQSFSKLAATAGCKSQGKINVECLLALPASKLESIFKKSGASVKPTLDGVDLTESTEKLAATGHVAPNVPIIAGSVREDLGGFSLNGNASQEDFEKAYRGYVLNTSKLAEVYADEVPMEGKTKWFWAALHAGGDYTMTCPARRATTYFQKVGSYRFWFTHAPLGPSGKGGQMSPHACEIPFVFNVRKALWGEKDMSIQPSEYELSDAMVTYWTNFAASGNPNKPVAPAVEWPAYHAASDLTLDLDIPIVAKRGVKQQHCQYWDEVVKNTSEQANFVI